MDIELKSVLDGIKTTVEGFGERQNEIQKQLDSLDLKFNKSRGSSFDGDGDEDPVAAITKAITEHPGFESLRESGRGRMIVELKTPLLEQKATVTSSGIVPYTHETGIADSGRRVYGGVRRMMRSLPIETGSAQFLKETAFTDATSPQTEASAKGESTFSFTSATSTVQTIAAWVACTKQVLDDLPELNEFIRTSLLFGLERKFETEVLTGDGLGSHLSGLVGSATAFSTGLLAIFQTATGYSLADYLGAAILQLNEAGYGCSGIVVNPRDWFRVQAQKDANRQYLLGSPQNDLRMILWNTPIVPSPALAAGTFLAGDFADGAHIRMRQQSTIDISDSHDDFFTSNKIAIRAEMRAALVTTKPGAFIYGSALATSPA